MMLIYLEKVINKKIITNENKVRKYVIDLLKIWVVLIVLKF